MYFQGPAIPSTQTCTQPFRSTSWIEPDLAANVVRRKLFCTNVPIQRLSAYVNEISQLINGKSPTIRCDHFYEVHGG